jgi:hypothetical protein
MTALGGRLSRGKMSRRSRRPGGLVRALARLPRDIYIHSRPVFVKTYSEPHSEV